MRLLAFILTGVSTFGLLASEIKTWPLPEGVARFSSYKVTIDGKALDVLEAPVPETRVPMREPYGYAVFEAEGEVTIEVEIIADDLVISAPKVVPASREIAVEKLSPLKARFKLDRPGTVCFEAAGRHRSLVIAYNPPERDVPSADDKNVVYFGPGLHRRELTSLKSGETLYLAGGAVLEGAVKSEGDNITIRGRGILSGKPWPWLKGPKVEGAEYTEGTLTSLSGNNLVVKDIAFFSPWCWTLVLSGVTNAIVDNVKVIGGRVINDDGIDICRAKEVVIRNSFIRCQDDCIAPKWSCDGLIVTNCTLWSDVANNIRVGFECDGSKFPFRNMLFKDLDMPHLSLEHSRDWEYWSSGAVSIQASNDQTIENIIFDDIRIEEAEAWQHFIFCRTMPISVFYDYPEAGTIRNVTFKNIHFPKSSKAMEEGMEIRFNAYDDKHPIENIKFDNVTGFGEVKMIGAVRNVEWSPVKVIFDTDMITDYDDMGALGILHALADRGEVEILATVSSTRSNASVAAIEIVNDYYGRSTLPVGAPKTESAEKGAPSGHEKYLRLREEYHDSVKHYDADDAPDAVKVYRKTLAEADDNSVVICTVGFLTNVAELLKSGSDEISSLSGLELIEAKVKKWIVMGGFYPWGHEYNFDHDPEAARYALKNFPKPIFFTDGQYGKDVYTGRRFAESGIQGSPVADVYKWTLMPREEINPASWDQMTGHSSWDLSAVLMAVRGEESYFTIEHGYYDLCGDGGYDEWRYDPMSQSGRVLEKTPRKDVAHLIDELLLAKPRFGKACAPRTFCNPMPIPNMPVGFLCAKIPPETESDHWMWYTDTKLQYREIADPSLLYDNGNWYVYPSCDTCWKSSDFGGTWEHVPLGLAGVEGGKDWINYAPTIVKHKGRFLLMGSIGNLFVADYPEGPYEYLGLLRVPEGEVDGEKITWLWDPMLFSDDDERLYLYWGSSATNGIWGCELDAANPLRAYEWTTKKLIAFEPTTQPWEQSPDSNPPVSYIEGPWMVKEGNRYILTYSAAGTEHKEYAMGQAMSSSPLGPFIKAKTNPFFITTDGLVTGTAHGSVVKGPNGYWASYCIVGGATHRFERFIGFDRVAFGDDGEFLKSGASEVPQWLPPYGNGSTGWENLIVAVTDGYEQAIDGKLSTYVPVKDLSKAVEFSFGVEREVMAYRLIWHDVGIDLTRGIKPGAYQYLLEYYENGEWKILVDESANKRDLYVDYRETQNVKASALRLTVLGSPNGITPALKEFTAFGK